MSFQQKLDQVLSRYKDVQDILSQSAQLEPEKLKELSKEFSDLSKVATMIQQLRTKEQSLEDTVELLEQGADPELKDLAQEEKELLKGEIEQLNHQIRVLLLPKDKNDERNVIIEIRAGTG